MTLKNNRAPLPSDIKLYASFYHHMWIQTRVTVRKRLSWVVTSVTLTFDLWPWPFAWTFLWSLVIIPENFMMIGRWEHSQKGVTDRRTDRRTDGQTENTICRAAWSQLKIPANISRGSHNSVMITKLLSPFSVSYSEQAQTMLSQSQARLLKWSALWLIGRAQSELTQSKRHKRVSVLKQGWGLLKLRSLISP